MTLVISLMSSQWTWEIKRRTKQQQQQQQHCIKKKGDRTMFNHWHLLHTHTPVSSGPASADRHRRDVGGRSRRSCSIPPPDVWPLTRSSVTSPWRCRQGGLWAVRRFPRNRGRLKRLCSRDRSRRNLQPKANVAVNASWDFNDRTDLWDRPWAKVPTVLDGCLRSKCSVSFVLILHDWLFRSLPNQRKRKNPLFFTEA